LLISANFHSVIVTDSRSTVWNVHAHCYVSTSSGSLVSHLQRLSHSTCQTYDVWLSCFQHCRPSLLERSTGCNRTVKSTMISHRPLFYLFTVRKHVGQ